MRPERVSEPREEAGTKKTANVDQGPIGNTTNAIDYKTSLFWNLKNGGQHPVRFYVVLLIVYV